MRIELVEGEELVRRQGPCHSRAAIDTRRQEALQSASAGVRSIPFSVVYKGTSTEGGIRGFIVPGDVRAPITVCEQRIEVGGERGIRTLGRVSPTHAFQACAFNHSAISPYLESTVCERRTTIIAHAGGSRSLRRILFAVTGFGAHDTDVRANCVRPLNVPRSLTAIYSASGLKAARNAM